MRLLLLSALALPALGCDTSRLLSLPERDDTADASHNSWWVEAPAVHTPAEAAPGTVIVRENAADGTYHGVRASCAANTERLVGGGCHGTTPMQGRPFGYGRTDTLGAGWECSYEAGSLRGPDSAAYALCEVIAPPDAD